MLYSCPQFLLLQMNSYQQVEGKQVLATNEQLTFLALWSMQWWQQWNLRKQHSPDIEFFELRFFFPLPPWLWFNTCGYSSWSPIIVCGFPMIRMLMDCLPVGNFSQMAVFIHYVPMKNFVQMYCSWPVFSLSPLELSIPVLFPHHKRKKGGRGIVVIFPIASW